MNNNSGFGLGLSIARGSSRTPFVREAEELVAVGIVDILSLSQSFAFEGHKE
jgi:hypothetical protein